MGWRRVAFLAADADRVRDHEAMRVLVARLSTLAADLRGVRCADVWGAVPLPVLLLAFAIGCAAPMRMPPLAVLDGPAVEILTEHGNAATATALGADRWLTNRHVLGEAALVRLDGAPVRVERLQQGEEGTVHGDWVMFQAAAAMSVTACAADFTSPVVVGEKLWVLGFRLHDGQRAKMRTVLRAVVTDPPGGYIEEPGVVCLQLDAGYDNKGLSGSPVLRVDASGTASVVAIFAGRGAYSHWHGLWTSERALAVRPTLVW